MAPGHVLVGVQRASKRMKPWNLTICPMLVEESPVWVLVDSHSVEEHPHSRTSTDGRWITFSNMRCVLLYSNLNNLFIAKIIISRSSSPMVRLPPPPRLIIRIFISLSAEEAITSPLSRPLRSAHLSKALSSPDRHPTLQIKPSKYWTRSTTYSQIRISPMTSTWAMIYTMATPQAVKTSH